MFLLQERVDDKDPWTTTFETYWDFPEMLARQMLADGYSCGMMKTRIINNDGEEFEIIRHGNSCKLRRAVSVNEIK